LARADWKTPWNEMVYQSDSSKPGWGVRTAVAQGRVSAVRAAQRTPRFRRTGPHHSARKAALAAAGLHREDGVWVCSRGLEGTEVGDEWTVDPAFEEVDAAGLREGLLRTVWLGCWQYPEDTLVLEARACEKGWSGLRAGCLDLIFGSSSC
jgi:hypothetical protein